jgi:hypothetical protein
MLVVTDTDNMSGISTSAKYSVCSIVRFWSVRLTEARIVNLQFIVRGNTKWRMMISISVLRSETCLLRIPMGPES